MTTQRLLLDDEALYRLVVGTSGRNTSDKPLAAERDKLKRRQKELSTLLFKLFEDHAAGLISDENYVSSQTDTSPSGQKFKGKIVVFDTKLEQQVVYQTLLD